MGLCLPDSSRWFDSKTQQQSSFLKSSLGAEMFTKPCSFFPKTSSPVFLLINLNLALQPCLLSGAVASSDSFNGTNSNHLRNISLFMVKVHVDSVVLYKLPFLSTCSFWREKCNDLTKHSEGFFFSKPTYTSSLTLLYSPAELHLSLCSNEGGVIFLNCLFPPLSLFFPLQIVGLSQIDSGILLLCNMENSYT